MVNQTSCIGNNNKSDLGILSFPIRHRSIMEVLLAKMQFGGQYFSRSEKFVAFKEALTSNSKHQQKTTENLFSPIS